ncbi:MAG: hypothetical protein HQK49_08210 [Oligoflexia bacterium]|nr:hypothetical protein [Oligoflexia bacterium]
MKFFNKKSVSLKTFTFILSFISFTTVLSAGEFITKNSFDIESALLWQAKNQFQVPNNSGGTRIDIKDSAGTPFLIHRFTYYRTLTGPHQLRVMIAPLEIKSEVVLDKDILFQNRTFQKDELVSYTYKFNSYRLSYVYNKRQSDGWSWHIGGTLKVRDAKIAVKGKNHSEEKKNLGFVPLLNFGADYHPPQLNSIVKGQSHLI